MSCIPDDLDAWERDLRRSSGYRSPLEAATPPHRERGQPRSAAVLRTAVPTHERELPDGARLNDPFRECPVPRGTVIIGPVTSRDEASEQLTDGVGWLLTAGRDGTEPVPVVTGEYYDGSPRLAIIAEVMFPPPESDLEREVRA